MECQKATSLVDLGKLLSFLRLRLLSDEVEGGGTAAHHVKHSLSPQILSLAINSNYRVPVTGLGTLRE